MGLRKRMNKKRTSNIRKRGDFLVIPGMQRHGIRFLVWSRFKGCTVFRTNDRAEMDEYIKENSHAQLVLKQDYHTR